jgi:predicted dehydrogenase
VGETAAIELRLAGGLVARCRAVHGSDSAEWLHLHLEDRLIIASIGGSTTTRPAWAGLARRYLDARTTLSSAVRRLTGAPAFTAETFERQLTGWADVLRGKADGVCADGADGGRCVALVEACRRSSAEGGAWVAPETP